MQARSAGIRGNINKPGLCYAPDLDACSAFGHTPEEALQELERAKQAWLESAQQAGKPIPPPRYRPLIYQVGR